MIVFYKDKISTSIIYIKLYRYIYILNFKPIWIRNIQRHKSLYIPSKLKNLEDFQMTRKNIKNITDRCRLLFAEKNKDKKISLGDFLDFQQSLKELEIVLKRIDEAPNLRDAYLVKHPLLPVQQQACEPLIFGSPSGV